ncbi:MAG: DUF349 domain-containing protein [Propioniciclava sp.]
MTDPTGPETFGRVDADGTVYVTTNAGERAVGAMPGASADEAMAFFVRRYQALELEVSLLEQRLTSGTVSPDDARHVVKGLTKSIAEAAAVGDLDGLQTRLDGLAPRLAEATEARRAEKARAQEQAREAKEAMVGEAETLAQGQDWRGGVNRFRALLEEWKALPRIDKATDDALWHRFSSARTTYTRRRKAQFAEQAVRWEEARLAKERIITEARELADSTDWGPTSGTFRDLMTRWKAAGPAKRDTDDKLWREFRDLQDQFFDARNAAQSAQNEEFEANRVLKDDLLTRAETAILPISDLATARSQFRDCLEEYHQIGKVPREAMRGLDQRVRAIESALKRAEEAEWKRTDPEARQRAEDTVAMLTAEINKLREKVAKAEARGDSSAVRKAEDSIATYTAWLEQAQQTLAEFSG